MKLFSWLKRADAKPQEVEAPRKRADNLENSFLGYGTSRDKLAYGSFVSGCRLTDVELNALYYSDDIGAKIVNDRPEEMFRRGYKVKADDQSAADALKKKAEALGLDTKTLRTMQWARWQGGAIMAIGATDSPDLTKPLEPSRARDVRFLNVLDRRYVGVMSYQDNPFLPGYQEPEIYTVGGPVGGNFKIHASRVIRFDGVEETDPVTRRQLGGWTYSVLQRPYDVMRKFATSFDSVSQLMADASQGVWSIQGLIDMIANNKDELVTRMAFTDMTRSAGRAVMVDAETEGYTRVPTSFAGIDAVLDRFMMRVSAAADMPVTRLFGRSAAGMNATGEGDIRGWYDVLSAEQNNVLKPALMRVYEILAGGKLPAGFDIEFNPLWEPTELEQETVTKMRADRYKVYVDMGALMPEQVAIAEYGSGEGEIELDEAFLKESLDNEIELALNPPDPATMAEAGKPATANGGPVDALVGNGRGPG